MKGHFVQFKRLLMFNLADGLEHVKEMLNERVKTNKKISQQKKGGEKNFILSNVLSLKMENWGGRGRSLCWAVRSEMLFLPPIKAFTSVLGLRVRGTSHT